MPLTDGNFKKLEAEASCNSHAGIPATLQIKSIIIIFQLKTSYSSSAVNNDFNCLSTLCHFKSRDNLTECISV